MHCYTDYTFYVQDSTIESIVGTTVPKVFTARSIPDKSSFAITRKEWNRLLNGSKLHPKWGDVMCRKTKESNPYCCFAFKRHWVKKSFRKGISRPMHTVHSMTVMLRAIYTSILKMLSVTLLK